MSRRTCRLCNTELVDFYYRTCDTGDSFYVCVCGAINNLKRPATKPPVKFTNEWTSNTGTVSLEEAPPRLTCGAYHTGPKKKRAKERVFPQDELIAV